MKIDLEEEEVKFILLALFDSYCFSHEEKIFQLMERIEFKLDVDKALKDKGCPCSRTQRLAGS